VADGQRPGLTPIEGVMLEPKTHVLPGTNSTDIAEFDQPISRVAPLRCRLNHSTATAETCWSAPGSSNRRVAPGMISCRFPQRRFVAPCLLQFPRPRPLHDLLSAPS